MTVVELIESLKRIVEDYSNDKVLIWDAQSMAWETVTGFVYGEGGEVQMYSDE